VPDIGETLVLSVTLPEFEAKVAFKKGLEGTVVYKTGCDGKVVLKIGFLDRFTCVVDITVVDITVVDITVVGSVVFPVNESSNVELIITKSKTVTSADPNKSSGLGLTTAAQLPDMQSLGRRVHLVVGRL
jgi:hypothetical protein